VTIDDATGLDEATFTTAYRGATARVYQALSRAGFAPEVIDVTPTHIVARRHLRLHADWLPAHREPSERDLMARKIRDLLAEVHATLGICHRDVHLDNIVVTDSGEPLLIDPEFAVRSANEHCYDLVGPGLSGVAIPWRHLECDGPERYGVWWGCPYADRGLAPTFGAWTDLA